MDETELNGVRVIVAGEPQLDRRVIYECNFTVDTEITRVRVQACELDAAVTHAGRVHGTSCGRSMIVNLLRMHGAARRDGAKQASYCPHGPVNSIYLFKPSCKNSFSACASTCVNTVALRRAAVLTPLTHSTPPPRLAPHCFNAAASTLILILY